MKLKLIELLVTLFLLQLYQNSDVLYPRTCIYIYSVVKQRWCRATQTQAVIFHYQSHLLAKFQLSRKDSSEVLAM